MTWIVSIPVWGSDFHRIFRERAYPTIMASLMRMETAKVEKVVVMLHTDRIGFADDMFAGLKVAYRELPSASLPDVHRDVINSAADGDWVSCLNADVAVSGNFFFQIANHLEHDRKQAVAVMAMRTMIEEGVSPPVGASPRELLAWGWFHRHPVIQQLEWGAGNSNSPTHLFFSNGSSVIGRAFQLHPVAFIKWPGATFKRSLDSETLGPMPREFIHVVTDPDDMAMIEMSPESKQLQTLSPGDKMSVGSVVQALRGWEDPERLYRWQFGHRIVLYGTGAKVEDQGIVNEILAGLA